MTRSDIPVASSFFRDPIVYKCFEQQVLQLLEPSRKELRVWSAGCARGEEPYSIAILIQELLKSRPDLHFAPILFASDIDADALDKARAAVYPPDSMQETGLHIIETYFSKEKNQYVLNDTTKQWVHFWQEDLLAPDFVTPSHSIYGSFDIVFCRNVLLHFDPEQRDTVLGKLCNALEPGGYLILGLAEQMSTRYAGICHKIDPQNNIFRKQIISTARTSHAT